MIGCDAADQPMLPVHVTIKARQEQVMQSQLLEGFYCETSVEITAK